MAGGKWDPAALPERAGLYINFVTTAVAQTVGGARGIVAIPLTNYGMATASTFHTIKGEKQAADTFGAANIDSIKRALSGGAREVLVYTLPTIDGATVTESIAYTGAREAFEARPFNVFVYDGIVSSAEQDAGLAWMKRNKDEGKHFNIVFGCVNALDDDVPATGDSRSVRLLDKYAVNLINGVVIAGAAVNSADFAPYVAGLIAGTPINRGITFAVIPVDDVTRRMTTAEIRASLEKGSLVLVHDGDKVKVERGITTDKSKLRKVRAEVAIATDITKTGSDSYIGKLDNTEDGQKALISAIKAYLERLADANVLIADSISVALDDQNASVGDKVFLKISFVEVDSMEQIFTTITVGGA